MTSTSATDRLCSYLNDHLGGASTGVELAERLQEQAAGTPDAEVLGPIAADIEADRAVLRSLIEGMCTSTNPVKEAVGWVAEKAHRLALSEPVLGAELARLLERETLVLGIEGKLAMWMALREVADGHPAVAALDLDALAARARDQQRRVESVRLRAVRKAFGAI